MNIRLSKDSSNLKKRFIVYRLFEVRKCLDSTHILRNVFHEKWISSEECDWLLIRIFFLFFLFKLIFEKTLFYVLHGSSYYNIENHSCFLSKLHAIETVVLMKTRMNKKKFSNVWFMSFGQRVEYLFWFFQPTQKSGLKVVQITINDLFCVNAP